MSGLFKVTPSFVEGERFIEVVTPLVEADFTFTDKTYENTRYSDWMSGIRVGVEVTGVLNPVLLAQVIETFPKDSLKGLSDHSFRDTCAALASGTFRMSEELEDNYRGCRNDASRKAKEKRVLPEMRNQVNFLKSGLRRSIVERVNGLIAAMVKADNDSYMRYTRQNLVQVWDGLHEQAGVASTVASIAEALALVHRLEKEVQADLNAWMLNDMNAEGWKVNDLPLAPPLIAELKEIYGKGKAFGNEAFCRR